jgi:excisionase family DNA binding protein
MPDEVLTIKEVAALLKLAEKTVYAMANAGEVPAFRVRGQWRIKRDELDRWIDAQPRGGARAPRTRNGAGRKPSYRRLGSKRVEPVSERASASGLKAASPVSRPARGKAASR